MILLSDVLGLIGIFGFPIGIIMLIVQIIRKEPKKAAGIVIAASAVAFIIYAITTPYAPTTGGVSTESAINSSELTKTATYDGYVLELEGAEVKTNDDGQKYILVHGKFTNNNEAAASAGDVFNTTAFQDDEELDYYADDNEDWEYFRDIRNGKTIDVQFAYSLNSDSDVEITINDFSTNFARAVYSVK